MNRVLRKSFKHIPKRWYPLTSSKTVLHLKRQSMVPQVVPCCSFVSNPVMNQIRWFSAPSFPSHEVVGMPALSPTMEMGTIVRWNKKEGDAIAAGDIICEVETDKATVDYEAQDDGYVAKILVSEGTPDVPVGQPIFVLVEEEESVPAFSEFQLESSPTTPSSPPASEPQETVAVPQPAVPAPVSTPVASNIVSPDRVFASPLARKVAREAGITLQGIVGSGPKQRIVYDDVQNFLSSGQAVPASHSSSDAQDYAASEFAQRLAQQLTEQKFQVPHYHLSAELNLNNLLEVRKQMNDGVADESEQVSVNDLLIRAAGVALQQVPAANSAWMGTFIRQYHDAHINVMMSVNGDLVSPILRNVNQTNVKDISKSFTTLLDKATHGQLDSVDMEPGTFTISNMGMYGIKALSGIVSPNQSCSLGLGEIEKVVIPNDAPNATQLYQYAYKVNATLACDHRVVDGAVGAQWLSTFKLLVENPYKMLF